MKFCYTYYNLKIFKNFPTIKSIAELLQYKFAKGAKILLDLRKIIDCMHDVMHSNKVLFECISFEHLYKLKANVSTHYTGFLQSRKA